MRIRILCFFFNDTAATEIYTLSLHDALPISSLAPVEDDSGDALDHDHESEQHGHHHAEGGHEAVRPAGAGHVLVRERARADRKSTRLNSSHANISYAVFCLKKKKKKLKARS